MKTFLTLFAALCISVYGYTCSCAHPPNTFITTLRGFTAQLKVVEIDTLLRVGEQDNYWPRVIYRLEVEKRFRGSKEVDYVWMENIVSTDCQRGIFPDSLGQQYVITGQLFEGRDYKPWLQGDEPRVFLQASTCGEAVLDVEDDMVIGVITKNNDLKIRARYEKMLKEDPEKAKAYYEGVYRTKHHEERVQKMLIADFYKLMEKS